MLSRRSCCPYESLELSPLLEWSNAEQPEIPFSTMLKLQLPHATWRIPQVGPCSSGLASFLLMIFWWGWTYRASNSSELEQLLQSMWLDRPRSRFGITHDSLGQNWVPLLLSFCCFAFRHQLAPHSVPNFFPRAPLYVSWGLGVCSVLVTSVSPCRLVLDVRLFPSPHALFWPFARRLCPLFSSSCLSRSTRLRPGVCVCNIWIDVKPLFFFNLAGGLEPICLSSPTKIWHFGGWVVWSTTCTCIIFSVFVARR